MHTYILVYYIYISIITQVTLTGIVFVGTNRANILGLDLINDISGLLLGTPTPNGNMCYWPIYLSVPSIISYRKWLTTLLLNYDQVVRALGSAAVGLEGRTGHAYRSRMS